jgi:hypothetical protein
VSYFVRDLGRCQPGRGRKTYDETETSGSTSLTVLHDDALEQVSKALAKDSCDVCQRAGSTNVDHVAISGEGLYIRKQRRDERRHQTETERNKRTWCRRSSVVFHERLPRTHQNRNHETERRAEREREERIERAENGDEEV